MAAMLSDKPFTFEVMTPERTVLREEIVHARIPVEDGSIGILAHHAPLVAPIRPGTASLVLPDGSVRFLCVQEGFAHVGGNRVRLLVDASERGEDIDLHRAESALERAKERLIEARRKDGVDVARAQRALERARAREQTKALAEGAGTPRSG